MLFLGIVVFVVSTEQEEHYREGYITSEMQNTARRKVQFVVSAPCADYKKMDHPKPTPEEVKERLGSEPVSGKLLCIPSC